MGSDLVEEAEKYMKSAEKKLKKSLFKWSVSTHDHDTAAVEFQKAARNYQLAHRIDEALEAYELAAEHFEKGDMLPAQAGAFEAIASIYKDQKKAAEQVKYLKKASHAFVSDGQNPDRGADPLVRAARVLRDTDAAAAAELLREALQILFDAEQLHMMPEPGRLLVAITTKSGDYVAAADAVKLTLRHIDPERSKHLVCKAAVEMVVLHLARNDPILAQRAFEEIASKHTLDIGEETLCRDLIQAFNEADDELLSDAIGRQLITFIHPDIARLAKKLKLPGDAPVRTQAPTRAEQAAPQPVEADEDDWR